MMLIVVSRVQVNIDVKDGLETNQQRTMAAIPGLNGVREMSYPGRMWSPARRKRGSEESMRCDGQDGRT
jgi:hypothetical protein